jgi:hypothetical protein
MANQYIGNLPFSPGDYADKPGEFADPFVLKDLSEWDPEVDGEIERLADAAEAEAVHAGMLDPEEAEPGELIDRIDDQFIDPPDGPEDDEDESAPKGDFDVDDDGWNWK